MVREQKGQRGRGCVLGKRWLPLWIAASVVACSGSRASFNEHQGAGGQGGLSASASEEPITAARGGDAGSQTPSSARPATSSSSAEASMAPPGAPSTSASLASDSTSPDPETSQPVEVDSGTPEPTASTPEPVVAGLAPGALCTPSDECDRGTCQPATEASRCCREPCAADQFCSGTGSCFTCMPGTKEACWETPDGEPLAMEPTDEGLCQIGERNCSTDGHWSSCAGAVGPETADSCSEAGADDDCDGNENEGCDCVDGTVRPCGSEVGNCELGEQTCANSEWGDCVGEVTSVARDSCEVEGDDANCDGLANDDCECIGSESRDCGDCGTQTCNPDVRDWNPCSAPQDPAETRCLEGSQTIVETCSAAGEWVTSSCDFICSNGACGGACSPGTTRCRSGPERRESCVAGVWDTVQTCATGMSCVDNGASCRRTNGGSCSGNSDCVSGHCVDEVCCVTSCPAVNCNSFNTECLTHPANVSSDLCGSNGQCRSAADVCADAATPRASGTNCTFPGFPGGRCDGTGECKPPEVSCGAQTCSLDAEVCCWKGVLGDPQDPDDAECSTAAACLNTGDDGLDKAVSCDEHADCPSGKECCWFVGSGGRAIYCFDSCPQSSPGGSWRELCQTPVASYSCPNGFTCEAQGGGYSTCTDN